MEDIDVVEKVVTTEPELPVHVPYAGYTTAGIASFNSGQFHVSPSGEVQFSDEINQIREDAENARDAAEASAQAAATSEQNAKESEDNAKDSETAAANSASRALASENAAEVAQEAAEDAQAAAETAENNAKASETAAQGYASAASGSASGAAASAGQASGSAEQAASSAAKAGQFASAAAISASQAAGSAEDAATSAQAAQDSADRAQEIVDGIGSVYKPVGSIPFARLPAMPSEEERGYVYNITDNFTTDARFVEGAGESYPAGSNVAVVLSGTEYKYDVLSGSVDLSNYAQVNGAYPNMQVGEATRAQQDGNGNNIADTYEIQPRIITVSIEGTLGEKVETGTLSSEDLEFVNAHPNAAKFVINYSNGQATLANYLSLVYEVDSFTKYYEFTSTNYVEAPTYDYMSTATYRLSIDTNTGKWTFLCVQGNISEVSADYIKKYVHFTASSAGWYHVANIELAQLPAETYGASGVYTATVLINGGNPSGGYTPSGTVELKFAVSNGTVSTSSSYAPRVLDGELDASSICAVASSSALELYMNLSANAAVGLTVLSEYFGEYDYQVYPTAFNPTVFSYEGTSAPSGAVYGVSAFVTDAVRYVAQTLTPEQQEQARENISAAGESGTYPDMTVGQAQALAKTVIVATTNNSAQYGWWRFASLPFSNLTAITGTSSYSAVLLVNSINPAGIDNTNAIQSGLIELELRLDGGEPTSINTNDVMKVLCGGLSPDLFCCTVSDTEIEFYVYINVAFNRRNFTVLDEVYYNVEHIDALEFESTFVSSSAPSGAIYAVNRNCAAYDGEGNNIAETYATKAELDNVSDGTLKSFHIATENTGFYRILQADISSLDNDDDYDIVALLSFASGERDAIIRLRLSGSSSIDSDNKMHCIAGALTYGTYGFIKEGNIAYAIVGSNANQVIHVTILSENSRKLGQLQTSLVTENIYYYGTSAPSGIIYGYINNAASEDDDGNIISTTYAKQNGTYSGMTVGNATNATKATQDGDGNVISDTYAKQTGTYTGMTVGNAWTAINANYASKANAAGDDLDGNGIIETYAKKAEVNSISMVPNTGASYDRVNISVPASNGFIEGSAIPYSGWLVFNCHTTATQYLNIRCVDSSGTDVYDQLSYTIMQGAGYPIFFYPVKAGQRLKLTYNIAEVLSIWLIPGQQIS